MSYIANKGEQSTSVEVASLSNLTSLPISTAGQFLRKTGISTYESTTPSSSAPEGTAVKSTGEAGGVKYLRENGNGTCSWQTPAGSGDMLLGTAQSVTETKTFTKDKLLVKGTSTGTTNITTANASASNYTATLPAKDGTLAMTSDITGSVTDVSVVTANGVSGSVATSTTTPAITLTLGAITPSSVNGLTLASQAIGFTIAGGTTQKTLTVPLDASVSGTNTGDQTIPVGGSPAITLGTANSAGSAATFVKTDATILAFDVTAPSTQAFGDSANVGAATVAARRDHKHAMMSAPTSVTGNAGTVTGATFTKTLTVDTGNVQLSGDAGNTSHLSIGAGATSVSGSNTGDNTVATALTGTPSITVNTVTTTGNIELGNASDTTLSRVAAGMLGVEGMVLNGWTSTATAGGVTTMDITYTPVQVWTGTTTQTIKLPTTGVVAGQQYRIENRGTSEAAVLTIQSSGANEILKLGYGCSAMFVAVQSTPTTAAHWIFYKGGRNVLTATSYTTDTGTSLNCDYWDDFIVTAQAGDLKLNNPTGTPKDGQYLFVAITGTAARNLTYDTQFEASTIALPTTTVTTARLNQGYKWRADTSKWVIIATC